MRILVTKLGTEFVKEITEEQNETLVYRKIQQNYDNKHKKHKSNSNSKSPKSSNISLHKRDKSKNLKNESLLSSHKILEQENKLVLDEEDLENSKHIKVKQKKLHNIKNIAEKYNEESRTGFILPDLTINHTNFNNKNHLTNNTGFSILNNFNKTNTFGWSNKNNTKLGRTEMPEIKKDYTFREILNETAYINLKEKIRKEKKIKDSLSKIDETKFRSVYGEFDRAEKFEKMLDKTINANKVTLINYINQKEKISDNFIKKMGEGNDIKIMKANKICQVVFYNKEKNKLFNDKIQERLLAKKNHEATEYKLNLENMGENLKETSNILNEYENVSSIRPKSRYNEIHNNWKNKYWKKYNVESLQYKSRSKSTNRGLNYANDFSKTQGSFV